VLEIMYVDFLTLALDQLVNAAAKAHLMSGGQLAVPLVLRTQGGAGQRSAAQHSQSLEAWLTHVPGLKVVMPSNAADAKGLLKSAIRDDDPVLFIETLGLLPVRRDVPVGEDFLLPLGVADVRRSGDDVTIVAIGRQVDRALEAADRLADEDVSVEVVDPRTLSPLDTDTIVASVQRTGRLVVAQEATSPYSFAAEVCAVAAESCLSELKAPPVRVTSPFINVPTPVPLAEARAPGVDDVLEGARKAMAAS
jgi:pyruvate dehydrogenase E1 component beta subunit